MKEPILSNPDVELYGKVTNIHFFRWFRIIVFEMSATCIFIYGVLSSQYLLPPSPLPDPYTPINNPIHSFFISCCLFLILCYSGQLTGGHCNPAVTLSLLITKGNKITPLVFVVYALSQFAGALLGGLIAWPLVTDFNFQQEADPNASNFALLQLRILLGQFIGTFLYTLFVLIIMNDHTTFVKSTFWNYCLIPIVFYIIRQATYQIDSLNPATTLAFQLFSGIKNDNWLPLSQYYLYIIGPTLGAIFSGVFYNYFYVPLLIRWKAKK